MKFTNIRANASGSIRWMKDYSYDYCRMRILMDLVRLLKEEGFKVMINDKKDSLVNFRVIPERREYNRYNIRLQRRTTNLSQNDWIEVNNFINDYFDQGGFDCTITVKIPRIGKARIRDVAKGRTSEREMEYWGEVEVGSVFAPCILREKIIPDGKD